MLRKIIIINVPIFVTGLYIGTKHHDKIEFGAVYWVKNFLPEKNDVENISIPTNFIRKATELSNASKFGVLSTIAISDENNAFGVASRAVQPYLAEFDENGSPLIYFNTNKLSRKVEHIAKHPRVAISFLNEKNMSCVTYIGTCERVSYPESKKYWEDWLVMFYPEGNDESKGCRITTWRIRADNIQMLSYTENIASTRYDGRPPEVVFDNKSKKWALLCNGKDVSSYFKHF